VFLSFSDCRSPIFSLSILAYHEHLPNRIHFTAAPYQAGRKIFTPLSFSIAECFSIEAGTLVID